ncbi:MAG: hypothetical protein KGD64_14950, partial [Candidatus Heimdallarchaeota archaeon]|nr:hypothetical protein [Candidatus Heimdallarchaeota archaeon]
IFFWVLWLIFDDLKISPQKIRMLEPLGKNSFLIYILHHLPAYLFLLMLTVEAHIALVIFFALLNVGILWLLAVFMNKKGIYITI